MANPSGHMSHHGAQGTGWVLVAPNELAHLASLQLVATRRLRRVQAGCTPPTHTVPTRSRSVVRAAAVPFLPTARSRTRRGGLRGPAHGRDAAPRRGGSSPTLDVAPPGRLGARALRTKVLSRDGPRGSPSPHAVVEEGQDAAGPGRPGAATSVHRAAPERAGRRPTRSAPAGLRG